MPYFLTRYRLFLVMYGSAFLLCACSASPIGDLRPQIFNAPSQSSSAQSQQTADRAECLSRADQVVLRTSASRDYILHALVGAVVGSATGALSGTILDDLSENVAAGAAVGTLVGLVQTAVDRNTPSESYQRFVEHCLHEKGYEVIGWREDAE